MVEAHATPHCANATILTLVKQSMFESYLAIYVQANTLISIAIRHAKLLPIIFIRCLDRCSNKSIKSKVIAPIARDFLAATIH